MVKRLLSAALMLIVIVPLLAQPAGRGIITMITPESSTCVMPLCGPITHWLYPTLFAVDDSTGAVVPSAPDNFGLVADIRFTTETTQQIILRDDLYWRDGMPVTAYDVLFNMLTKALQGFPINQQIKAVTIEDPYRLTVEFSDQGCALPARLNMAVLPAHINTQDFMAHVDAEREKDSAPLTFDEWIKRDVLLYTQNVDELARLNATAGVFTAAPPVDGSPNRFVSGETVVVVRDLNSISREIVGDLSYEADQVDAFLAGELSFIINPPFSRRPDLLAQPDLQIAVIPSEWSSWLMFNFADPYKPRDAFDAEGNLRDQGVNPIVGNQAIRQAIQLAIDVDEIIALQYRGYAEPLASLWPPTSWAHEPDRQHVESDFRAAQDMLQAEGWWDTDHDGIRECRDCSTSPIGTPLSLNMTLGYNMDAVAEIIRTQLLRVGIGLQIQSDSSRQRFDMYLVNRMTRLDSDPDLSRLFLRKYDRRDIIGEANYGSYYDEDVERLFTEALNVDSCDLATRRSLYSQIQDIFDAQTAVVPLFVQQNMIVAQPSVLGFDPRPGSPLWNIRDWVVMP